MSSRRETYLKHNIRRTRSLHGRRDSTKQTHTLSDGYNPTLYVCIKLYTVYELCVVAPPVNP